MSREYKGRGRNKSKAPAREEMQFLGESLITYGKDSCLGFLLDGKEHGVFDASLGKVDVTPQEASIHNKALSKALIDGLDNNCEVGQWGTAYLASDGLAVRTWIGDLISDDISRKGNSITFRRKGREFRGQLGKNSSVFNYKRIA